MPSVGRVHPCPLGTREGLPRITLPLYTLPEAALLPNNVGPIPHWSPEPETVQHDFPYGSMSFKTELATNKHNKGKSQQILYTGNM